MALHLPRDQPADHRPDCLLLSSQVRFVLSAGGAALLHYFQYGQPLSKQRADIDIRIRYQAIEFCYAVDNGRYSTQRRRLLFRGKGSHTDIQDKEQARSTGLKTAGHLQQQQCHC